MVQSSLLSRYPEIIQAFSDRSDGNMGLLERLGEVAKSAAPGNRAAFFEKLGIDQADVVRSKQVHGNDVGIAAAKHKGLMLDNETPFESADALTTSESNLFLAVFSADCLPILVYDPIRHQVAAIHAGWQGLSKGVIDQTISRFTEPKELVVAIGPHIKVCHYRLYPEIDTYQVKVTAFNLKSSDRFLDLTGVAMRQLTGQGVRTENIEVGECTACHNNKYFSYHEEAGRHDGLMMSVIGVKS